MAGHVCAFQEAMHFSRHDNAGRLCGGHLAEPGTPFARQTRSRSRLVKLAITDAQHFESSKASSCGPHPTRHKLNVL